MARFSIKNLLRGNASTGAGRGQTRGFPRTLNKSTLWAQTGSDITCAAGIWTRVGEYTIPAQQTIHLGYGQPGVNGANFEEMGHVVLHAHDDAATNSAEEPGYFRIGMTNANETMTQIYLEERSEVLGGGLATANLARNLQLPFPEVMGAPVVITGEDSKIIVDFKSDAADIVVETAIGTGAFDVWQVPITVYQ